MCLSLRVEVKTLNMIPSQNRAEAVPQRHDHRHTENLRPRIRAIKLRASNAREIHEQLPPGSPSSCLRWQSQRKDPEI